MEIDDDNSVCISSDNVQTDFFVFINVLFIQHYD